MCSSDDPRVARITERAQQLPDHDLQVLDGIVEAMFDCCAPVVSVDVDAASPAAPPV